MGKRCEKMKQIFIQNIFTESVLMLTLLSLATTEVVIMTAYGITSDDKVSIMTALNISIDKMSYSYCQLYLLITIWMMLL